MGAPNIVRVRKDGMLLEVQVEGWGTMLHSQAIREWVEASLSQAQRLRVDLSRCTYMDSTFIGTLLGLKRLIETRPGGALVLACPSPECVQLLDHMRIGKIFTLEPATSECSDWQEVCVVPEALRTRAFRTNVVEAHQCLANCEGPTGDRFRQLAADMSRELEKP